MIEYLKQKVKELLVWSQKYTKTDMLYLAKGGFWLGLGQAIGTIASLATSIAFANLLPVEAYGQYRYVLSMMAFFAIPTLSGINTALIRAAAQGMDSSLYVAFKTRLSWGVLAAVAGLGTSIYYLVQVNIHIATSFLVVSIFMPLFYSFETYGYFLKGKKMFNRSALFSSSTITVSTISLVISLFLTDNVAILLISYFLPYTLLRGLFLYITTKKYILERKTDPTMVPYGKHLSLMSILDTIASEIDKFLLWHFLGPVQVAVYSFALSPVSSIATLKTHLNTIAFPKIAEHDIPYIKKIIYGKTFRLFLVLVLIAILYVLIAPALYKFMFPKYTESVIYSQVLAISLIFPAIFFSTAFVAHAKIKEQYILNSSYSLSKIVLSAILIPLMGIWGAVISYLAPQVVSLTVRLVLFNRLKQ